MRCDVILGKGSCWGLPRVFKPRQASMHLVVSKIWFPTRRALFGERVRTTLWWQQLLSCTICERDRVCCECV